MPDRVHTKWFSVLGLRSGPASNARRATDPVKARYTELRSLSFLMHPAAATAASLEPGPPEGNAAVLRLRGRLDVYSVAAIWDAALAALDARPRSPVIIDATAVEYCDGAGIALLVDLLRQRPAGEVEIENLKPTFDALLKQFDPARLKHDLDPEPRRGSSIEEIGGIASEIARDTRNQIAFVGETTLALIDAARHPR